MWGFQMRKSWASWGDCNRNTFICTAQAVIWGRMGIFGYLRSQPSDTPADGATINETLRANLFSLCKHSEAETSDALVFSFSV